MPATDFPFSTTIEVRFRDVDAMGHVNNAVFFTYMETARFRFFDQFLNIEKPKDTPFILGETNCRYLSPLLLGETVTLGLGVARFGIKSFTMVFHLEGDMARPVAIGRAVMVMYDYVQEQTIPIPPAFKAQIQAFQGDWQPPDRKSTRLNSSHSQQSRMPSSA